jgi:hypothetical protein
LQAQGISQKKRKKLQKKNEKKQKDEKKPGVTYTAGGRAYMADATGDTLGAEYVIRDGCSKFSTIESVLRIDGDQVGVWKFA